MATRFNPDPNATIARAFRAMQGQRPGISSDALYRTYTSDLDPYNRTWKPTPWEPRQAEVEAVADELGVADETAREIIGYMSGGGTTDNSWMDDGIAWSQMISRAIEQSPTLEAIGKTLSKIGDPNSWSKAQPVAVTRTETPRNAIDPVAPSVPPSSLAEQERAERAAALRAVGLDLGQRQMGLEALGPMAEAMMNEQEGQLATDLQQLSEEDVASYQSMISENARMSAAEESEAAALAAMENQARLDALFTQEEGLLGPQRAPAAPAMPETSRLAQFAPPISLQMPVEPTVDVASVRQNNVAAMLAERAAQRNAEINAAINAPLEGMRYSAPPASFAIEDDPEADFEAEMAAQLAQDMEGIMGAEMAGARQQEARALEAQAFAEAMAENERGMAQRELSNWNEAPPTITPPAPTEVSRSFNPATYQEPNMPSPVSPEDRARAVAMAEQAEIDAITAAMAQNEMGIAPPSVAYSSWNDFDPGLEGAPGPTPANAGFVGFNDLNDVTDVTEADVPGPAISLGDLAAAIAASRAMDDVAPNLQNEMESLNDQMQAPTARADFSFAPVTTQNFPAQFAPLDLSVDDLTRAIQPQAPVAQAPTASLAPVPAPTPVGPGLTEADRSIGFRSSVPSSVNDESWEPPIQLQDQIPGSMTSQIDKYGNPRTSYYRGIPDNQAEARTRQSLNANRALARALGLPENARVGEIGKALTDAIKSGRMTAKQARSIVSQADKDAAEQGRPSSQRRSSLDGIPGLGAIGQVLADLNPFSIAPAQAAPMLAPPPNLPAYPSLPSVTVAPPSFAAIGPVAPTQPSSAFATTPGGSFLSVQDAGLDPEGEPTSRAPVSDYTSVPAATVAPSYDVPTPAVAPGVAAPDAPSSAREGARDAGMGDRGVASSSFGAGIGVGNSSVGQTPSYAESVRASEQMDDNPPSFENEPSSLNFGPNTAPDPRAAAFTSFAPMSGFPGIGAPTTLGDLAAMTAAEAASRSGPTPGSFRSAQEVGMEALNSSLASLASSYATPTSMVGNYGPESVDTTEADPEGGLPGTEATMGGVTAAEAVAAGLGAMDNAQDGPGTNDTGTGTETGGGGGGDGSSGDGSSGGGSGGGGDGSSGDGGGGPSGGSAGAGSAGGMSGGGDEGDNGMGGSPGDGASTSGGPFADGGRVEYPAHYQAIIERALRAARRSGPELTGFMRATSNGRPTFVPVSVDEIVSRHRRGDPVRRAMRYIQ